MRYRTSQPRLIVATAGICLFGGPSCGTSAKSPVADAGPGLEAGSIDGPACPASCDDNNPCTVDTCDITTYQCVNAPVVDGTSCQGKPCTTNSICQGGLCLDGPFKTCTASDQCHVAGVCSPRTGECTNPVAPHGTPCDDGLKCTYSDQCNDGVCTGTAIVCGNSGTCDPNGGVCISLNGGLAFPSATYARAYGNIEPPVNGNGLVYTPDGKIILAAGFFEQTDLGTGMLLTETPGSSSAIDVLLAQVDPTTGNAIWTQTFTGTKKKHVTSFAANGVGQLGIVGHFDGEILMGDTELDSLYEGDDYILGASTADGNGSWIRRINLEHLFLAGGGKTARSGLQNQGLRGIAGDPVTGHFVVCGTASVDATDLWPTLRSNGGADLVVAALDGSNNGATLWAAQVGGANDEDCGEIAMDSHSNTFVVGNYRFGSKVVFGNLEALPIIGQVGDAWMYMAKFGPDGEAVWANEWGAPGQTIKPTAMVEFDDDLFVAGGIVSGALSLGGVDLGANTFVARYDGSNGALRWLKGIGAGGQVSVLAMADGGQGMLLVTGAYQSAFALGSVSLSPPGSSGATFVARLDVASGVVLAATGYGDPRFPGNHPVGIVGLAGGQAVGSMLLSSFSETMNLGLPVGLVPSSTPSPSFCLAGLAP